MEHQLNVDFAPTAFTITEHSLTAMHPLTIQIRWKQVLQILQPDLILKNHMTISKKIKNSTSTAADGSFHAKSKVAVFLEVS